MVPRATFRINNTLQCSGWCPHRLRTLPNCLDGPALPSNHQLHSSCQATRESTRISHSLSSILLPVSSLQILSLVSFSVLGVPHPLLLSLQVLQVPGANLPAALKWAPTITQPTMAQVTAGSIGPSFPVPGLGSVPEYVCGLKPVVIFSLRQVLPTASRGPWPWQILPPLGSDSRRALRSAPGSQTATECLTQKKH